MENFIPADCRNESSPKMAGSARSASGDGTNVVWQWSWLALGEHRLTLRSAMRTAQRAIPT
jgi:hypothetical protein